MKEFIQLKRIKKLEVMIQLKTIQETKGMIQRKLPNKIKIKN